MTGRVVRLPAAGRLLVAADLHGNHEDYAALRALFLQWLEQDPDSHWLLLGDAVHGPDAATAARDPALYGYADRSFDIVADLARLRRSHPNRIHYLLGNHDHAHLGGRATGRFHPDEAAALEDRLTPAQRAALRTFFDEAQLAAVAPCGLLFSHASPGAALQRLSDLDRLALDPRRNDDAGNRLLHAMLWPYSQSDAATRRLLRKVSADGIEVRLLIHGHDRDEEGWFIDGRHALCPVLFGAPPGEKRYLDVDLAARYDDPLDLREHREIRRLHPAAATRFFG